MKISSKVWDKYVADLRKINDAAAAKVSAYYETHLTALTNSAQMGELLAY